jgi:rubredoxin
MSDDSKSPEPRLTSVEWFDDNGDWNPFPNHVTTAVQQCLDQKRPTDAIPITIDVFGAPRNYTLNLTHHYQTNTQTGFTRPIRLVYPVVPKDVAAMDIAVQANFKNLDADETCPLCLAEFTDKDDVIYLKNCNGHYYHRLCPAGYSVIDYVQKNKKCPVCKHFYGEYIGDMPPGTMQVQTIKSHLKGYPHKTKTLHITFQFPGTHRYGSDYREAYLPDTPEGRKVLALFEEGWKRKVLFTVGYSQTRDMHNVIIYNGIHMKTSKSGTYGYPDPTYLDRVTQEFSTKGIV